MQYRITQMRIITTIKLYLSWKKILYNDNICRVDKQKIIQLKESL